MRGLAFLPLLAAPAFADYTSDLLGALKSSGLTSLAQAITNVSSSDEGKALIGLLSDTKTNFTVFAPNNAGFAGAFPNTTGNGTAPGLANVLRYHVVAGDLQNYTSNFPNTTIGRTYLNASNLVQLEGGKSQVLAWSFLNGNTTILNQNTPVVVVNQTRWQNLAINVVDGVIDPPGNLSNALAFQNLSTLATVLATLPGPSGGNLLNYLDKGAKGFTLFAPRDEALKAAMGNQTIAAMLANKTTLATVLGNHIVNGSSIYSSELYMNATSASGQYITSMGNATIMSGEQMIHITTPDILLSNGVVHIVDNVILNANQNTAVASSAYESATSAAGTAPMTTETAPIGNTATFSQTGAGASSTSGSGKGGKNGAVALGVNPVMVAVSVVGVLAGGMLTLA